MSVSRIRAGTPTRAGAAGGPAPRAAAGFAVPAGHVAHAGQTPAAPAATTIGILGLQEPPPETRGDRPACRRGHALLDELAALQRELLAPAGASPATLRRIAALVDDIPEGESPALRQVVHAIRLRAVAELARYSFVA